MFEPALKPIQPIEGVVRQIEQRIAVHGALVFAAASVGLAWSAFASAALRRSARYRRRIACSIRPFRRAGTAKRSIRLTRSGSGRCTETRGSTDSASMPCVFPICSMFFWAISRYPAHSARAAEIRACSAAARAAVICSGTRSECSAYPSVAVSLMTGCDRNMLWGNWIVRPGDW